MNFINLLKQIPLWILSHHSGEYKKLNEFILYHVIMETFLCIKVNVNAKF